MTRAEQMCDLYRRGHDLAAIGAQFRLSHERVRQLITPVLVQATGLTPMAYRSARIAERRKLVAFGGYPRPVVTALLELSEQDWQPIHSRAFEARGFRFCIHEGVAQTTPNPHGVCYYKVLARCRPEMDYTVFCCPRGAFVIPRAMIPEAGNVYVLADPSTMSRPIDRYGPCLDAWPWL